MIRDNIVVLLVAIFGAGGFWEIIRLIITALAKLLIGKKGKTAEDRALLGLLHNEIYSLCKKYIKAGEITVEEFENLQYLYKPYHEMGGNGTAEKLMKEIHDLPMVGDKR